MLPEHYPVVYANGSEYRYHHTGESGRCTYSKATMRGVLFVVVLPGMSRSGRVDSSGSGQRRFMKGTK